MKIRLLYLCRWPFSENWIPRTVYMYFPFLIMVVANFNNLHCSHTSIIKFTHLHLNYYTLTKLIHTSTPYNISQVGISHKLIQYQFMGWMVKAFPRVPEFVKFVCEVLDEVVRMKGNKKVLMHDT